MSKAFDFNTKQAKDLFLELYGPAAEFAPKRYEDIYNLFVKQYGEGEGIRIFSAPGRSEIGGNHTDHNFGRVLAAAVSVDTVAFVRPRTDGVIRMCSEGYHKEFVIDLNDLSVQPKEEGTTQALIRGVAARMKELGYEIGGFEGYASSTVLRGSGLSSSAAFEVLVGAILEGLYNGGVGDAVKRAQISQYAENVYFGKPCGLMDQSASSVGGLITIDFADPEQPIVQKVPFDFSTTDFNLVVVNTGGSHADLTDEYAAIRVEMEQVAGFFGKKVLRQVDEEQFYAQIPELAKQLSHRHILRSMHFYNDNRRVGAQVEALSHGDLEGFLSMIVESGESSWKLLQNCYVGGSKEQGLTLALALSEKMLKGRGAWRVHGGGFAGTIQAFVPHAALDEYVAVMDAIYGQGATTVLSIRNYGAIEVEI